MTQNYRVLKLKSGDSIVAELVENSKSHIKIMRPMDIKYMHFIDTLGRKHETMILVDWLKSTTTNSVKLEKDFILQIFTPSPDVVRSYDQQKSLDDNGGKIPAKNNIFGLFSQKDKEGLDRMLQNIEEQFKGMNIDMDDVEDMIKEGLEDQHEELIEDIIDQKTAERIIVDEDSPDYGTSYIDWSPNPQDYLS